MDNASYLAVALRLANADLTGVEELRAALHEEPWWSERVTGTDLEVLRQVAAGLRAALVAAVAGDTDRVLHAVNDLLAAHPLRPRLSAGHDESAPRERTRGGVGGRDGLAGATRQAQWHVHVADPDAPPATEVAAAASWGIAQGVVRYGLDRWGHCAATGCGNYFLDTSTNRAKRFCSARCANRVHVAAFRSRNR